jgi:predicted alpha/beta-hydrolase family hydrolase
MSLRDTARGVAIRGGVLVVGGALIGGWIVGMAMKAAGKAVHLLLLLGVSLVATGVVTYQVKKHLQGRDEEPGPRRLN